MSNLMKNYTLNDGAVTYVIEARDSKFNPGALFISTHTRAPAGGQTNDVYVSRENAIDFAWSILEHYEVAERPAEPLAEGDFVVFGNGSVGKIAQIDICEPALYVEELTTNPVWRYTNEATRISKEEFVEKASAQAVEQITKFAEEG